MAEREMQILRMLIAHEVGLHDLYADFVARFPGQATFWQAMADEERLHAEMLETLLDGLRQGTVTLRQDRLSHLTARNGMKYLQAQVNFVGDETLSLPTAIRIALDLEDDLLESRIFECFAGDDPRLEQTFRTLQQQCQDHFARLRAFAADVHITWERGTAVTPTPGPA